MVKRISKDCLRWHHVKILFWVVISSEKNRWLQLDVSISMLWSSLGEYFVVSFFRAHHALISSWKEWWLREEPSLLPRRDWYMVYPNLTSISTTQSLKSYIMRTLDGNFSEILHNNSCFLQDDSTPGAIISQDEAYMYQHYTKLDVRY